VGVTSQRRRLFFQRCCNRVIGDFQRLGKVLLVIVVAGIAGSISPNALAIRKVEEADPERLQELEQVAQEKLQGLKQEFQEHIPFKQSRHEDKEKTAAKRGRIKKD